MRNGLITHLHMDIALYHMKIRGAQSEITRLQSECRHVFQLHSQCLKNEDSRRWWIHRSCSLCGVSDSVLERYPACPECQHALVPIFIDDERTLEARTAARDADPRATVDFAFVCHACETVHGFAFRAGKKQVS